MCECVGVSVCLCVCGCVCVQRRYVCQHCVQDQESTSHTSLLPNMQQIRAPEIWPWHAEMPECMLPHLPEV